MTGLQKKSLSVPLIAVLFAAPALFFGGPLWLQDWRPSSPWLQANDLRLDELNCYGHKVVLVACRVGFTEPRMDGGRSHQLYYFLAGMDAPTRVSFYRQKEQRQSVTTDFGLDRLGNRSSLMAMFGVIWLMGVITLTSRIMRS